MPDGEGNGRAVAQKSTAELAGDLSRELTTLVHQEISLAKVELSEKGKRLGIGTGSFGAAAFVALLGFGALTACAIAALHLAIPVWASCLVIGGLYMFVAGAMALVGRNQLRRASPPLPEQALESTKEDVAWLKNQARSAKK